MEIERRGTTQKGHKTTSSHSLKSVEKLGEEIFDLVVSRRSRLEKSEKKISYKDLHRRQEGRISSINSCIALRHTYSIDFTQQFSVLNWENSIAKNNRFSTSYIVFDNLWRKSWFLEVNYYHASSFKAKLVRLAPLQNGHNQHDSREMFVWNYRRVRIRCNASFSLE
ncbi:hypothetical protein VNO77_30720 [Canavalia gladiata]|uniref:Uncharacterized protein n=1 Tax=Canavalia gladiata TaxID=3824 RepID=A0AAN9Q4D4_CANGL